MERRTTPLHELYEQRLALIAAADQGGFHCYHKAEHHFTVLDVASSANVFFAAAAQRTDRIRFGSLVYLLPFYDPFRLLEEICLVDQLSRGRLEIGVGKGVNPVEHRLWGLDPTQAGEKFDEAFAIIRAGLGADRLTHDGAGFSYADVPVVPEPCQPEGPPIWYPGNIGFAGPHRLNTVVGGPTKALGDAVAAYSALVADAQEDWNPAVAKPVIGATRHLYVAATDAEALARVQTAYPRYHENLSSLWHAYDEDLNSDPSVGGNLEVALGADILVAGSPDTVAQHVQAVREQGIDYFMGAFAWGDLTHEESMTSLDLFSREVMPRFG